MTASDLLRVVVTVATVQCVCDLVAYGLVFNRERYRKALGTVTRTKANVDKAKPQENSSSTSTASASGAVKSGRADKLAKRLKRFEDDYADALAVVSGFHFVPSTFTAIIFLLLFRILGSELNGTIVALLPFRPFQFLRRITGRGLEFPDHVMLATAGQGATGNIDVTQACSFMAVYALTGMSVKFYIQKLFGTPLPEGVNGIASFLESPTGRRIARQFGLDDEPSKTE